MGKGFKFKACYTVPEPSEYPKLPLMDKAEFEKMVKKAYKRLKKAGVTGNEPIVIMAQSEYDRLYGIEK